MPGPPPRGEEVFLPLPAPRDEITPATHARSTILISSVRGLRAAGYFDAYYAAVEGKYRDTMLSLTAGLWLPIDVAVAHYAACDTLNIGPDLVARIGFDSGRYMNQTVLSVLLRLSRDAGLNPWSALGQANRLTARLWQGSGLEVIKLGPKEGRMEWVGQPCGSSPYFAHAFASFVEGIVSLFCTRAYVRFMTKPSTKDRLFYRLSWV